MTFKAQAVIWVVFPSGISSYPVTLLRPVELQQKPKPLKILSLLSECGGCFAIFYF